MSQFMLEIFSFNQFIFAALLTAELSNFHFRSMCQSLQKGIVALQAVFWM